jgi:iron(III) transport system substrate-binding protein
MQIARRHIMTGALALAAGSAYADIPRFEPSAALVEAAKKDGGFVNYTAQIEDLELETIAAFNKRFPFVKVEIVHLPGGQLLDRIKAEIAWNSELIKDKPKGWWDLTGPKYAGVLGMPSGYTGGSTWVWVMFQRKVLGEEYWAKQAAIKPRIYTTNAVTADALVRGEIAIAPVSYPAVMPKIRDGAPLAVVFPIEAGITATAKRPAAAQLYLDWCLSEEGQGMLIRDLGHLTALKKSPAPTPGLDPAVQKLWFADRGESDRVRDPWLAEWSKAFGLRQ